MSDSDVRTLPRMFFDYGSAHPARIALVDTDIAEADSALSYAQLRAAAFAAARELAHLRGGIVAVRGELGSHLIAVLLGSWAAGVAVNVVDPRAPESVIGTPLDEIHGLEPGVLPPAAPSVPCLAEPDEIAVVMATSGTSGHPKHVPLTHRALATSYHALNQVRDMSADDVYLSALPPSHIAGINLAIAHSLAAGARLVLQRKFDPERFLDLVQRHRVTTLNLVPTMLHRLIEAQRRSPRDLSSLRHVSCGASSFSVAQAEAFEEVCGLKVYPGYGLTETSSITHHARVGDEYCEGLVGPPLPGTEHQIVDLDTGERLSPGRIGEIWLRGPQITDRYLNAPAETTTAFPGGGWFRSGDLGHTTEEGALVVTGRAKEIIKYKGHQISTVKIERVIEAHPLVLEVAAAGVPDSDAGELPVAFVVPTSVDLTPEALLDWARSRMQPHGGPRRVVFVAELPRTTSGKVRRQDLVDDYDIS